MKKDLNKGLNWLDIDTDENDENSTEKLYTKKTKGLPDGWTRATFILREEYMYKIKACAYWERITIKELLEDALANYLQNKEVRDIPSKKNRLI